MLDMSLLLGAVPERFEFGCADTEAAVGFALARGTAAQPALEMTKWFDTNYHYLVPEFDSRTTFHASTSRLHTDIAEARMLNIRPKVVLVGPVTYVLGKAKETGFDRSEPAAAVAARLSGNSGRACRLRRRMGHSSTSPRWQQTCRNHGGRLSTEHTTR
jgi:hypothetical protein